MSLEGIRIKIFRAARAVVHEMRPSRRILVSYSGVYEAVILHTREALQTAHERKTPVEVRRPVALCHMKQCASRHAGLRVHLGSSRG